MTAVDPLGAVTLTDIVAYAGASGDFNPIHHDDGFARRAGFPGVISMGMLHGAWLLSHLAARHEPDLSASIEAELRFTGVVRPGDKLSAAIDAAAGRIAGELTAGGRPAVRAAITSPAEPYAPPAPEGPVDTVEVPVELGSARRFATAVRWPWAMTDAAATPLTYPTAFSWWLPTSDPIERLGFDPSRTLHGTCRMRYPAGTLRVGERLTVRSYVANTRNKVGAAGPMTLRDVVEEAHADGELRAVQVNTLIETAAPTPEAPRLVGSRDESTGQVFYPARPYSVDGQLRSTSPVELSASGVLWSWTTYGEQAYGQVDLPEGVRIQSRLAPGEHRIGERYEIGAAPDGGWWFAHA